MPQRLVIVGTGPASMFFLHHALELTGGDLEVVLLERGQDDDHAWQVANRRNSSFDGELFRSTAEHKPWVQTINYGGGSNCWAACTPRMMPNDFTLRSTYGVGWDWPVSYLDLAPHYDAVEQLMQVSGPDDAPFPRSGPYPQPPHRFNAVDCVMKDAYPDTWVVQPTARARRPAGRNACRANTVCPICPIDAKWTVRNGFDGLTDDPRITLRLGAEVTGLELGDGTVTGVHVRTADGDEVVRGDLVVLGAHVLGNLRILLASGLDDPGLGEGLHEQTSWNVTVDLDGLDNFDGSTLITGHGYMFYDGPWRSERAACLIEHSNVPDLRHEPGRWRQRLTCKFIFEELPNPEDKVTLNAQDPGLLDIHWSGVGAYAQAGADHVFAHLDELFAPLPVERIHAPVFNLTESHIQGGFRFGDDPATSVVDRHLVHHRLRNLVVLGSGVYPTCSPANPTLTIAALSRWSAQHLFGGVA